MSTTGGWGDASNPGGDGGWGQQGQGQGQGQGAQGWGTAGPGQGGGYGGSPAGPPPNNNLVWAILSTICCCLPFGIVSIVKAASVDGKWQAGDAAGARKAADEARTWALIALGAGIATSVLYVVFVGGLGFLSEVGEF